MMDGIASHTGDRTNNPTCTILQKLEKLWMNGTLHGLMGTLYTLYFSPARIMPEIELEKFHTHDVKLYRGDQCCACCRL